MNAKSHNAAVLLNDLLARLEWHGWHATGTADPGTIVLQYKSELHGCWREVDCDALKIARYIKKNPSRAMVAKVCDKKPEHTGTPVQQELPLSAPSAIVRAAMDPQETQH